MMLWLTEHFFFASAIEITLQGSVGLLNSLILKLKLSLYTRSHLSTDNKMRSPRSFEANWPGLKEALQGYKSKIIVVEVFSKVSFL
jgi:hypothetical protein